MVYGADHLYKFEVMNEIKLSELSIILKKSEAHASRCTIDHGTSSSIYRTQTQKGYLTLSVSSKMLKQAITVFEMFLKRMFMEGFSLTLDYDEHFSCPASALIVNGEMIPVRVKEKFSYTTTYEYHRAWRESSPSGILALEIYGGTTGKLTKTLTERKDASWEVLFDDVIPYLRNAAERRKVARLEYEDWRRRMDAEIQERKAFEQKVRDRAAIAKSIVEDILLFERARTMKRYCDIVEQMPCTDEYRESLAIARSVADWIDPTKDYVDELLSTMYDVEDFL